VKEARLHLRLDEDVVKGIRAYAARRKVTLTSLVEHYFKTLLEEDGRKVFDAEQA